MINYSLLKTFVGKKSIASLNRINKSLDIINTQKNALKKNISSLIRYKRNNLFLLSNDHRYFSDKPQGSDAEKQVRNSQDSENGTENNKVQKIDYDEYDDYEEPKTAGQKVAVYGALLLRLSFLMFGAVCVYFTARELFPGRMNPNSLFSEVFDILRINDQILSLTGDDLKAFGRDTGRNTEGRRNHIDSYKYTAPDGSNRLRIRFNIKGSRGQVVVWAEVSDRMPANEYVYIICQSTRNGRVYTIVDDRERLEQEMVLNLEPSDNVISKYFFKK